MRTDTSSAPSTAARRSRATRDGRAKPPPRGSGGEAGGAALARLRGLLLAVLGGRRGDEPVEQAAGRRGDLLHGVVERGGVGLRGAGGAADLADVLERGLVDLVLVGRRLEVVQGADVAAHA